MPKILSACTALPSHVVSQNEIKNTAAAIFAGALPDLERMLAVFETSRIRRRQFVMPLGWYLEEHAAAERARIYVEEGLALLRRAVAGCLERAGVTPAEVGRIVFVSSTGLATPTLDAYLINELGMPPGATRLPVWGLGCAGGAAGLARAFDFCTADPAAYTVVAALETCSLTFLGGDATKKNVVAASLFSDGAAAALVAGDATGVRGPDITAVRSRLFPDTYRVMGWEIVDAGMQLVLSPRLPAIVKAELPAMVAGLRSETGIDAFSYYLTHPGGAKVVDAYREALDLEARDLLLTDEVLAEHGNMSSVSVLAVLEKWLAGEGVHGGYGLLSAFGPGFSAEMLVLREGR